jgi:hypothetical protein
MTKKEKKLANTMEILELFKQKNWQNDQNKNLINLLYSKRLRMHISTLFVLDKIGFNHLEIMQLDGLLDQIVHKLPTFSVDFLNILQEKYAVVFNLKDKQRGQRTFKLNSISYHRHREGFYCGNSPLSIAI